MTTDDYVVFNARADAAKRWIAARLVRVEERPGGDSVLDQLSWAALYADYKATVPSVLHWQPWRLAQELPMWLQAGRYYRKSGQDSRWPTTHYAGVRLQKVLDTV